MGQKAEGKPTTTLWGKPVLTKYFQHQSSMDTREVYLIKASHFSSSCQFRYSSMEKEQVTCWQFLLGDFLIWGFGSSWSNLLSHTSHSSLLPTNISHQTRHNTQHFGSPTHFTHDLHESMVQLFLSAKLFIKLYSDAGVWQSDSIWTVSKT